MKVRIKKLHADAVIPTYATSGAAGFDFVATEDIEIPPGSTRLVKTGLSFEIPEGFEIQVRPRSGLSLKTNLRVANSPGTIDADYRGEVGVIMTNISTARSASLASSPGDALGYIAQTIKIKKGERIAQGVLCPVLQAEFDESESLSETARGDGGFGSSGI